MIDQVFFAILLPLPIIVAVAMLLYFMRAWRTSTPRLRRSRVLAALWLGACASILFFCRERVRGWTGFDVGSITIFMIASAGVLVFIGIAIGLIATIGRSTRSSLLCPRCWYDMGGVEPKSDGRSVCPECGAEVASTSDLVHRKRWPIFIAVAVAFQLAGQFSYQLIRADHGGAQNFVPTTILVAGMFSLPADAIIGPPSPFDFTTLSGRLANKQSADWQVTWALNKAVDAIARADNREAVARAATILNRCRFDGEIPLQAWKASVRLLCEERTRESAEALSYLTECYVRARSIPDRSGRISFPTDSKKCADELRELVPYLLASTIRSQVRSQEWWSTLRLLALAGDGSLPIVDFLEQRVLLEETDVGRANSAAALAMLSPILPEATDAAARAFTSLPGAEQPRVLNAIARYVRPSPEFVPTFRALAVCSEPPLEIAGAVGLLGASETRCEGAEKLIAALHRHAVIGNPDLASIYAPVAREPGDGASTMLIIFLEEIALTSHPWLRVEAMANLSYIARDFDSRSPEILAFLDYVGNDRETEIAVRARSLAADIRSARSAPAQLRNVAVIR